MKYKLVVKETAKAEIVEVAYQYEKIQENLGYKFSDAIDIALQDITVNPLGYQIKYDNYRTKVVKPFPYLLIFEVIKKEVIVYQCFVGKDDPARLVRKK